MVLVAAVLLDALPGSGRNSDVLGHAIGLSGEAALGLGAAGVPRPPAAPVQWTLGALAALTVAGCWRIALDQ